MHAASLTLAALALASCRAFPLGLYVPDEVLDRLETSRFQEELDDDELTAALAEVAGQPVALVHAQDQRYWRLDLTPELGPLAPESFRTASSPAAADLAAGDLVLLKNARAQSLATTLTFAEFTFYDHMGVLVEREGELFVCDSWPSFHALGTAPDFASRFQGGVRLTPLPRFLAHYETLLVVELPDPRRNARLAAAALAALDEGLRYDPYHDPTDARLSCSEFVQLLLTRAGYAGPSEANALAASPELRAMLSALGFPSSGFFAPDPFAALAGARTVAWISRWPTRAAASGLEAGFAFLHRRFSDGELRLADLLAIDRWRFLRYRANALAFLRGAQALAALERFRDPARFAAALEGWFARCFRPLTSQARARA